MTAAQVFAARALTTDDLVIALVVLGIVAVVIWLLGRR